MISSSRMVVLCAVGLMVAGCSGSDRTIIAANPDPLDDADLAFVDYGAVRKMEPQGAPFVQTLRSGYLDLMDSMSGVGESGDKIHFARKAVASAKGINVQPDETGYRRLAEAQVGELGPARVRLLAALEGGGRRTAAVDAGKAQVAYDCWLEAVEDNDTETAARCKAEFERAITAVERSLGPGAAREYLAYFAWDRVEITPVTRQTLEQVAADYKDGRITKLHLAGHTDRSGTERYNMALSERRAKAVSKVLEGLGVPVSAQEVTWFGETRPRVPTNDGVREERNRRVEITFD